MLERVQNTISRYNMIPVGARVGVAVSGGADSVFLLHALREVLPSQPLSVIHIDHGLRGAHSAADAGFAADLASTFHLPFFLRRMPPPTGNLEQFCRQARLAFFRFLKERGLVERIATGHTASDQAETVLMRLVRGTGPSGLRGILPVTAEGVIRPLLALHREEIRDWLRARGIAWREDTTNSSPQFLRNRIRAEFLPNLRSWQPGIDRSLVRLAGLSQIDEQYWEGETERALQNVSSRDDPAVIVDCGELRRLHPALGARVLRAAIRTALGSPHGIDYDHVQRILGLAANPSGTGRIEFPGGRATRSFGWLRLEPRLPETPPFSSELAIPGQLTAADFTITAWIEGNPCNSGAYTKGAGSALDWERLRRPLRVRPWQPGDRFRSAGQSEARPVKELFERGRVPLWERRLWPMITDGAGIIWIRRFGAACDLAADESTRLRLRVRCDTVSSK